jgi:hypothetical protein
VSRAYFAKRAAMVAVGRSAGALARKATLKMQPSLPPQTDVRKLIPGPWRELMVEVVTGRAGRLGG